VVASYRKLRYLARTDSIDSLHLSTICYLFRVFLPWRETQRQKEEKTEKELEGIGRRRWDSIIFSSLEWKSFYFLFRKKKVEPCQTFYSWSSAAGKLRLYFFIVVIHNSSFCFVLFYFILFWCFPFFLSAIFLLVYVPKLWTTPQYIELQVGISTRMAVIFLVLNPRYRFKKLIWFLSCLAKNRTFKCSFLQKRSFKYKVLWVFTVHKT